MYHPFKELPPHAVNNKYLDEHDQELLDAFFRIALALKLSNEEIAQSLGSIGVNAPEWIEELRAKERIMYDFERSSIQLLITAHRHAYALFEQVSDTESRIWEWFHTPHPKLERSSPKQSYVDGGKPRAFLRLLILERRA